MFKNKSKSSLKLNSEELEMKQDYLNECHSKNADYENNAKGEYSNFNSRTNDLEIQQTYLRTEDSKTDDREYDKVPEKCNNFNSRKNDAEPIYIVQHHTVVDWDGTINHFTKGGVSAHFVIGANGDIEQMVGVKYRAYHAGAGDLISGSKLNPSLPEEIMRGDMNSWSIGIENVNNGYSPFPKEQMKANILLMDHLVSTYQTINPKLLIGHADWNPSRKCDPNPYFDWELAANARKYYDVDYNFGVWSKVSRNPDANVVISGNHPEEASQQDVLYVQELLAEIGYSVFDKQDGQTTNEGIYDKKTRNCVKAFKNHYLNKTVVKFLESIEIPEEICNLDPSALAILKANGLKVDEMMNSYNPIKPYENYDNHHPFMINVTANDLEIISDVADLLGQ